MGFSSMPNYILPIGASDNAALVGGKAASLARMRKLGLAVPPGFVLTTEVWREYSKLKTGLDRYSFIEPIVKQVIKMLPRYEDGSHRMVSVRSGAPVSMPGMMDTVLNVGATFGGARYASLQGNGELAWAVLARFLEMYSKTTGISGIPEKVQSAFEPHDWYSEPYNEEMCLAAWAAFTDSDEIDVEYALIQSVQAVLDSWNSERAIEYRAMHGIPDDLGTAVTVQQMVFGNAPDTRGPSATGVLFSRDPNTGESVLYGEWLEGAQGEDVVAGLRPALSMGDMMKFATLPDSMTWNGLYDKLLEAALELENEYRDMVDIEWTCENGKLWFLQCRPGKRSEEATVKIAVDMANEGLITQEEAVQRARPVARLLAKQTLVGNPAPIATGDNASYGVAAGVVVFSSTKAKELAPTVPVVLVRRMTDPQDVGGMNAASAILTQEGGPSSHAAVVARELGKPCVTGASIVLDTIYFDASGHRYFEGDWLTIDGTTGSVYAGKVEFETTNDNPYLDTLKEWGL